MVQHHWMLGRWASYHTFTTVLWTVTCQNAIVFGFIMAALLAALMSAVDTLINACAAIGVNDLYRRLSKKEHSERHVLMVARVVSAAATGVGLLLVWLFTTMEKDLFNLHYQGIRVIIPAMVTVIFMGAFWPRFTSAAAMAAMVGGSVINFLSLRFTQWVDPLSRFLLAYPPGGTAPEHSVFRGIFGCLVTAAIGIVVTAFTPKPSDAKIRGLTVFSLHEAMRAFKGGLPTLRRSRTRSVGGLRLETDPATGERAFLPQSVMDELAIAESDLVYIADGRWWRAGLRSVQLAAGPPAPKDAIVLSPAQVAHGSFLPGRLLRVERIM